MHSSALLIIDMQSGFDDESWGRRNNPGAEIQAMRLLKHWRARGHQIVHVRHDSDAPSSPLAPGRSGNAFKPGFEPSGGEWLVAKTRHSAFDGTDLEWRLRSAGIGSVTILGLTTDQCVSTTARMACDLGFDAIVAEDACACFEQTSLDGAKLAAESIHLAHVTTLNTEFARVVRVDDLLGEQVASPLAAPSPAAQPRRRSRARKFGMY